MIRRLMYITAVQIVIYAVGFPMLIAYEMSIVRLNSVYQNPTASALSSNQTPRMFPGAQSAR